MKVQALGFAMSLLIFPASGGQACSCGGDGEPLFMITSGAILPANIRGIPSSGARHLDWERVELWLVDGTKIRVPFRVEVVPYPPGWAGKTRAQGADSLTLLCTNWEPGAKYRLGSGPGALEFSISKEPFLIESCGIDVWENTQGSVTALSTAGSCSAHFNAHRVAIELSQNEVMRWGDALLYYTVVDDEYWHPSKSLCDYVPRGRSWVGNGRELLYSACYGRGPDINLKSGEHRVTMIAWLPGVKECRATATVRLGCN